MARPGQRRWQEAQWAGPPLLPSPTPSPVVGHLWGTNPGPPLGAGTGGEPGNARGAAKY